MRPHKSYILALALAALSTARAADAPKPEGLMAMLEKGMTGHAVIAVGTGGYKIRDKMYDETEFAAAKDELGRLQVISKAASTDDMPLIPFAVRKAWVIAPEFRQDLRSDFSGLTPLGALSYDDLINRAVLALSPEQMEKAGEGIPFAQLPEEAQTALKLALRPPFDVKTLHEEPVTADNGEQAIHQNWTDKGRVTEPVDWSRVRFRACLVVENAYVTRPESTTGYGLGRYTSTLPQISMSRRTWGTVVSIYDDAPNKFRPSDLNAAALTQLVGVAGVLPLKDLVARLAKVTGLRLSVMPEFRYAPAFVGREDIACGDVMDGLRLALTGTWRRLGDNYILAWDKPGWVADRLRVEEATAGISDAVQELQEAQKEDSAWLAVAERLPFDPEHPLSPTEDQRRRIFSLDWKPGDTPESKAPPSDDETTIPYDQMTPAQQKFLQEAIKTDRMYIGPDQSEPYTEGDLQYARIGGIGVSLRADVNLPGFGWVATCMGDTTGTRLYNWRLWDIRQKAETEQRSKEPPPWRDEFVPPPTTIPTPSRALMVPALGPSEVTEIIGRMKAHGLDTLMYPALDAGYATFPSKAFPLSPGLRGKDGWAAASAAAKESGIRLVAWLSPAVWQVEGQKVHWLDKHPGWLDVDALGRPRLEWLEQNPPGASGRDPFQPMMLGLNYVRPAEPEVARKLDVFVAECARLTGATALAIVDWRPFQTASGDPAPNPPPLGFATPDRIAAFAATGNDPADEVDPSTPSTSAWTTPRVVNVLGWNPPPKDAPDAKPKRPYDEMAYYRLTARVLDRAKAARKDWQTWRLDAPTEYQEWHGPPEDAPPPPPAPPPADRALRMIPFNEAQTTKYDGSTLPVPPRSMLDNPMVPPEARQYPPLAFLGMMAADEARQRKYAVAVYDFRQAPEDIMRSLKWIAAPTAKK